MENLEQGICFECSTKDGDSSKKTVYRCDVCGKWYCELHRKPKFPYFVDWDTQFDVQGNPAVKAMFYSEYGRQDGHADFIYLRSVIEAQEIDEKERKRLIEEAMDKMMNTDFSKPVKQKNGDKYWALEQSMNLTHKEAEKLRERDKRAWATETYANKFGHEFPIPAGIYSIDKYYKKLNNARTLEQIDSIISEYKNDIEKDVKRKNGKKHWWQKIERDKENKHLFVGV